MNSVAGRHIKLFRNGRNQALRIPPEFELPGDEAVIHNEGERLIIEPSRKKSVGWGEGRTPTFWKIDAVAADLSAHRFLARRGSPSRPTKQMAG